MSKTSKNSKYFLHSKRAYFSWKYNGFGFAIVWIDQLYVQLGTLKLIIYGKNIQK